MTKFKFQGTGQTTGGFDSSEIIQLGVIAGVAVAVAAVIIEFAWLIITLGAAAVAVRLYLHHRRTAAILYIAAKAEQVRAEQQARRAAALNETRRHEIAVAEAGRPVTVIQNVIDPAPLAAAVTAAVHQQPAYRQMWPQPAPAARAEVER